MSFPSISSILRNGNGILWILNTISILSLSMIFHIFALLQGRPGGISKQRRTDTDMTLYGSPTFQVPDVQDIDMETAIAVSADIHIPIQRSICFCLYID